MGRNHFFLRLAHRCRPIRDQKQAIQVGAAVVEQTHGEKGSGPFFLPFFLHSFFKGES